MKLCAICGTTCGDHVNCCCPTCGEASWYALPYPELEVVPVDEKHDGKHEQGHGPSKPKKSKK